MICELRVGPAYVVAGAGQNAAAVQAICAIAVSLLTLILILVTSWYAWLTRVMARILERQLASSFQPNLTISFAHLHELLEHGETGENATLSGRITVRNAGSSPVKLVAVEIVLRSDDSGLKDESTSIDCSDRLITPLGETWFDYFIPVPVGFNRERYFHIGVVDCTDLAGVSKHSFEANDKFPDMIHRNAFYSPSRKDSLLPAKIRRSHWGLKGR